MLSYGADIICLQEVEARQFDIFFKPELLQKGDYEGVYYSRSWSRQMSEAERPFYDGAAIFFKRSVFEYADDKLVEFQQLALERSEQDRTKSYDRMTTKDNIAILLHLRHLKTKSDMIVGNVHLHWNSVFSDVRLMQAIFLSEEMEKYTSQYPNAAILLCGDFNSFPSDGIYEFLTKGHLSTEHPEFLSHSYTDRKSFEHGLDLRDAYGLDSNSTPLLPFTNYTPAFKAIIDYIYYRPNKLSVLGVLGGLPDDFVKQVVGLPNEYFPSDHISLLAEFCLDI